MKDKLLRLREFAGEIKFSSPDGSQESSDVQIMRAGAWEHPWYGTMIITPNTFSDMIKNFKDNVRRQDLPVDYFHESEREAAGWFTDLFLAENGQELWGKVRWTPKAQKMLPDKEVRYFSADFYFEWTDPETGVSYKNVLNGGGLVNRPFIKGMQPVTELSEGNKMTLEQAQNEIKTLGETISAKDAEIKSLGETITAKDSEIATLKAEKAAAAKEKELADKEAKFAKLCSDGKACAAQHDAFMADDMIKFAELAQPLNVVQKGTEKSVEEKTELSAEEKAACTLLGISAEDFLKYNK